MDYVIHTFGGGDILWQIFNGIGRVFASDSEYFTPVGKFALTIGGIWAGTRTIFKGNIGIFAMEWFFPSFFIFIFLFAPKATIWLKDEVSMSAPVKIDNIPSGVAFFSSVASRMSYTLSEMLEKHLLPPDEGLNSRKTGIMFGTKAVGKIRDIQIQDPITLTNSKEFLRQCFMKPYIIGNILGKKAEAQQTNDIISFIEQNMPNNFGIYYRDPGNSAISFKTCKQATPLIKGAINKELHDGVTDKICLGYWRTI
nr:MULTISPECIES: conjugal transfer protein TraG N-terminal domain-containing protein [spotted fever group]